MAGAGWYTMMPFALAERRDIPATAKLLLVRLRDLVGHNSDRQPGQRFLCDKLGLGSRRVLDTAVKDLEQARLLKVERVATREIEADGRKVAIPIGPSRSERKNRYELTPEALALFKPPTDTNGDESRPSNGDETTPLNGDDSAPLPDERCQNDTANGDDSRPLTGANRALQTDKPNRQRKTKRRAKADPWELALGAMANGTLRTDRFRSVWANWVSHRAESKKPLTPSTIKMQIRDLESLGEGEAIARIEQSIANGWKGLFPTKDSNGSARHAANPSRVPAKPGKYDNVGFRRDKA